MRADLGLWDATSMIVGIMIGVGIFETPQEVFESAPGPWQAMLVWALGGVLALVGTLCFAELASATRIPAANTSISREPLAPLPAIYSAGPSSR